MDFDEISGTTTYDTSGHGNDGVFVNSASSPAWRHAHECRNGACLEFDGDNDYVYADDSPSLDIGGDQFTVSLWFKANSLPGDSSSVALVYKEDSSYNPYVLSLGNWDGAGAQLYVSTYNTSNSEFLRESTTAESFSTGVWYYVAGVLPGDGSKLLTYINGVDKSSYDTGAFSGTLKNGDWRFDVGGSASGGNFDGLIDDVRVYPYARTPAQIALGL